MSLDNFAASLLDMKNVCPDKYCTSKLSEWEGEAIILDKVTVSSHFLQFLTFHNVYSFCAILRRFFVSVME